jgi:hypothetical protein
VWKGKYCGRDVAVKVVRTYSNIELQKVVGVSYCPPPPPLSACLRTDATSVEVLQGGRDVENTSAPERPATDRGDDVRESVRNDIRLDGQRQSQRLCEGTSGRTPVGTGRLLTQSPTAVH